MEDAELEKVAIDFLSLTEPAKGALRSEMAKRELTPADEIAADHAREIAESEARKPLMIRRYRDLPEAAIAKSVLDSARIDCFLADDNLVRLDWFYSNLSEASSYLFQRRMSKRLPICLTKVRPTNSTWKALGNTSSRAVPIATLSISRSTVWTSP
jgi:hypothetical protein